jgi:hypothetical protein
MSDRSRFQFNLRTLLFCIGMFCAACALLLFGARADRDAKMRRLCRANLENIASALCQYYDVTKSYPPLVLDHEGTPYSWRVGIDWGIDGNFDRAGYKKNLPWNHPTNWRAVQSRGSWCTCPNVNDWNRKLNRPRFASYVTIIPPAGMRLRPDSFVVVEIADSDIYCSEPRDLKFDEMSFKINDKSKPSISSHHHGGAFVLVMVGNPMTQHLKDMVFFLDDSTDPEEVRAMLAKSWEPADLTNSP